MAHVVVGSECWPFTGGASEFEIEAATVREVIASLDARFPGLGDFVDRKMAFAIDGEIHQDAWFSPVGADSEIYLIPKIGGG
ncbi:MAG TPA: MoaD/ThiS family protein [Phenylobacterium sp.]